MKGLRNKAGLGVSAPGLLLVFLTLCSLHQTIIAQPTLLFGVAASLTGPYSEWSDAVNGFKLWESTLNAAGGISMRDINGTVYKYNVKLVVRDDASTAAGHAAAVSQLLNTDQVQFVLGASPVFAESETIAVQAAGRLNFQCCAGAATIYARDQKNVFGMSVDNSLFTQELFTEYRSNNIYKISVVYREDVQELASQCQGVVAQAKAQLLTLSLELKYTNGTNATISGLADQIAAAPQEALIMCGLASESADMVRAIDARRKPLKSIVMTGGAYARDWNDALGDLSVAVTSLAHWSPDLPRKDDFWGDAPTYAGKYKSIYQKEATQWAAAASATGYVLHTTLANIFRRCTISAAAAANPSLLFFTQDAISCADNNNRGHDRLVAALPLTNMDSVFGVVSFNRFRQNQGYDPVTLQTYEVTENLKLAFKPSLVLPLLSATRPLLLPQTNRYIEVCQPGTFRGPDAFVPCTACPTGQFQEFPGKTNCELCPKDYFGNTTAMPDCLACPTNTLTFQRGSTNLTDCSCQPGYFNRLGLPGLPCEACPSNAYCAGGTALPSPDPGFYAEQSAPFTMYPCNPSSVCDGNFTCAKGYRGRMCYYCAPGHYRFLGNCVACPGNSSAVIGYLLVMALLWVIINVSFARTVENLMVIINFCQMLSIVVGFSLNWPKTLYTVMSFSSILSFEVDSLEPTCLVHGWGFANNLVVQLLLPLMIAGLVGLWCAITYAMYKYKQWGMTRSVRAAASLKMSQEEPWKQVMWALLDVPQDIRELRETFLERAAVPLNFLNIGFLVLLKYCLSSFRCERINGVMYMYMSPNDMCYTTKHWNLMLLGTTGLIVYSGGFIYLYGHAMRALAKSRCLGDKKPLLLYGWMYERYEAQYYWYESVIILQRTAFVLVSLFVLDPALQAVLCMVVCVVVLLLDIRTSSYVDKQIHILQAGVDGALGAVLVAGLLFYNPLVSNTVVNVVSYVLLALVLAAFGSAAISVGQRLVETLVLLWLMSKHRPIAYKMGQRVRGYRHMYQVFGAAFLFNWLRRCTAEEWDDWHKLCMVLIDYVHPTSEVSYLSLKKVGRFWRYLLSNFPETIDYLASVSEEQRDHFNSFIEVLYDNFFDTKEEHHTQLNFFVQDKFKAAFAQWLSSCDEDDRDFCQSIMKTAVAKARGAKAANELTAAMTRSSKQLSNVMVVASAVDKFKRGLVSNSNKSAAGNDGANSGKTDRASLAQVVGMFDRSTHNAELDSDKNGPLTDQVLPHTVSNLDEAPDLADGGPVHTGLYQRGQRSGTAASGSSSGNGNDGERLVLPAGMAAALAAAKAPSVASGYRDSGSGGGSRQGSGRRAGSARRAPSGTVELSGRSGLAAKAPQSPAQLQQPVKLHDNALFGAVEDLSSEMAAVPADAAGGVRPLSGGTPPRSAPGTPRSATAKLHTMKAASAVDGGLALDMGIDPDVEELHLGDHHDAGKTSATQPPAADRAPSSSLSGAAVPASVVQHRLGTASGAPPRTPTTASLFGGMMVRGTGASGDGGGGGTGGNQQRRLSGVSQQGTSAAGGDVMTFERQDTIPEYTIPE